ncbi:hypothetical protein SAMN05421721_101150 [Ectothiorhodospira mobilis]|uniref:Sporulation related domain-containing protein n=1 Tax=Ectothiorhodospira mobilis TaxID=195064 RepID=A0A1I4PCI0_ECTMO|nr:hypothetical protein [Ectothiorhodospira mobilis]SFM25216.1 hypothetical protein SAMN05421721_101150 [Ectothiorhodospira mobilis]
MRLLFALLVLLNLAWLGYTLLSPPVPDPGTSPLSAARPGVPLLRLAQTADPPTTTPGAGRVCHRLGPFQREAEAVRRLEAFRAAGMTGALRRVRVQVPASYWVVLPMGEAGTAPLIRRLQAAGLTDYFVILDGARKGDLSLGLFSGKRRAARHLDRIRSLGLDPVLVVRFQERSQYWLELAAPGDGDPGVLPLPVEGMRLERRPCPGS